jgi:hypothetical protein
VPARPVTTDELAAYRRDGSIVVRHAFPEDQVGQLRAWTDEVQAYSEIPGAGYMVYGETSLTEPGRRLINRLENFYPYHAGFKALFDGDHLLGRVSASWASRPSSSRTRSTSSCRAATASSPTRTSRRAGASTLRSSSPPSSPSTMPPGRTAASSWRRASTRGE